MSKGLNNIGNTCYLNSGLQMLIQNKDFCKRILEYKEISENFEIMSQFISNYYDSSNKSITPDKVKRIVERVKPIFRGTKQHDSEEFIISLIEILNNDIVLNTINKQNNLILQQLSMTQNTNLIETFKSDTIKIILDFTNNKIIFDKLLQLINSYRKDLCNQLNNSGFSNFISELNPNENSLKEIFEFEIEKRIKCKEINCLNTRFVFSKEILLTVPINEESSNLDECYHDFKAHELLTGDEMVECEKCVKKQVTSTKINIRSWSKNLIICLNRYKNSKQTNNVSSKINKDIEIPFYWRHGYKIRGAVVHSGQVGGGHYFYIGRNIDANNWTIYDDSSASQIINNDRAQQYLNKAYIFHYSQ
jgi:ubiquitin C-terminal hydrolase